jgi:REP element-mobilizing transposase RayT
MSHSFVKNHIHLIFSTKERDKTIAKEIQPHLWSYMAGICCNQGIVSMSINGTDDHAHALFHLPPDMALATAVNLIKTNSSKWMNREHGNFSWQEGYAAFSVSVSNTAAVARYVRDQERHHRKMSFADEYFTILRKSGVEFDPKYVFG